MIRAAEMHKDTRSITSPAKKEPPLKWRAYSGINEDAGSTTPIGQSLHEALKTSRKLLFLDLLETGMQSKAKNTPDMNF
jgi:hypothetical protein